MRIQHFARAPLVSRRGFTVLELLVFAAIFTMIALTFVSILVAVTQIQTRQNSLSQVNKETLFLLQTIQRYIESSSMVEITPNISSNVLTLRVSSSSLDPTVIFASSTEVWYQEGTSTPPSRLNSPRVVISNLSFTKRETPGGQDNVSIFFNVRANTGNPQQQFQRSITTSIARRNAAIFDTGVFPSSTASSRKLGSATQPWSSIDDVMFFGSGGVGIGTSAVTPRAALQVGEGDLYLMGSASRLFLGYNFQPLFEGNWWGCRQLFVNNSGTLTLAGGGCPTSYGGIALSAPPSIARHFIPRAHATYFSSGLFPGASGGSYKLGTASQPWDSLNDLLYFDATNKFVGINVSTPKSRLHTFGGSVFIDGYWSNSTLLLNRGVIFTGPDGKCWRWSLSNTASPSLGPSLIACPQAVSKGLTGSHDYISLFPSAAHAATVDTGIFPTSDAATPRKLGNSALRWDSINDVLYNDGFQQIGIRLSTPSVMLHILDGDIYFDAPRTGIIFQSPNGSCWRWTVIDNLGNFATSSNWLVAMNCPS